MAQGYTASDGRMIASTESWRCEQKLTR